MFRSFLIFVAGLIIGAPVGAFLWYAFSPLLFDDVVIETLSKAETVATGQFRDADNVHQGSGQASLVQRADGMFEVQLSAFEVTNGPDLEVWLSAHPDPAKSSDVLDADWVSLGALKGNIGDQAYTVPAGTDVSAYSSVVIWCEQFGVLFSQAVLTPPS